MKDSFDVTWQLGAPEKPDFEHPVQTITSKRDNF
jgi:hypothetical protein